MLTNPNLNLALRDRSTGTVYPAILGEWIHADILFRLKRSGTDLDMNLLEHGFLTLEGRWLNRHDAFVLVKEKRAIETMTLGL